MKFHSMMLSWLVFAGMAPLAQAIDNFGVLPSYCTNRDEMQSLQPIAKFPMHHYCYGMQHLNRYYAARNLDDKKRQLALAASEFRYTIGQSSSASDPRLMAELYASQGLVHVLQNNMSKALTDYYKAIELNPKLGRVYAEIASYYEMNKMTAKALEVVTQGLRHVPDSKALRNKYQKLGGKLPFPEPVEAKPEEKSPTAGMKAAESGIEVTKDASATVNPNPVEEKAVPSTVVQEPRKAEETGTPKGNPYCRFCP